MKKIKVMSTFSGVGGLELGLDDRFEVIGMSEIYPSACDVLRYHSPKVKNYGDITKINPKEIPDFDMLVGGSPCQSLSTAGTRSGFKGKSKLFFDFVNLLKEKKPSYFMWENVSGTFTSTNGYDFLAVINSFHKLGYNVQWQLVNSSDFGSAQARSRVFVIGTKDEKDLPGLTNITESTKFKNGGLRFSTFCGSLLDGESIIPTITRSYGALSGNGAKVVDKKTATEKVLKDIVKKKKNDVIRLLTPLECERLMSWPDDHTKVGLTEKGEEYVLSDNERYKACGNGIVSLCVSEILKTFKSKTKHNFVKMDYIGECFYTSKEQVKTFLDENKLKENKDYEFSTLGVKIKTMKMVKVLLNKQDDIQDLIYKIKYDKDKKMGILLKNGKLALSISREMKSKKGSSRFKDVKDKNKKNKRFLKERECAYLLNKMK